ncbi:hypothetical protein Pelo_17883 [Pelomyxa schiedti]|nr:hypothetical protein Pelo_17883 [Pelomyxa schiedti]
MPHCRKGYSSPSFFEVMVSGKFSSTKDENGALFIDRNGELFAPILDFMRTGTLFVPPTVNADAVYGEAEFYQIQLPASLPTQQHTRRRPPFVYDFTEFNVTHDSRWNEERSASITHVDWTFITMPTSSELKELFSRMTPDLCVANVVTYIEAHSGWRVTTWKEEAIPPDYKNHCGGRSVQVYLYNPQSDNKTS